MLAAMLAAPAALAQVSGEHGNPAAAGPGGPPPDFPDIEVLRKAPGRAPGFLLVTPYYTTPEQAGPVAYLAMLDDDGAVHFQRRVSPAAHNFRWHERAGRYSYNEAPPNGAGDVVLLDERLEEVERVRPVNGLAPAMMHEFLITDEGNYLFVVNQPANRDLSRYPDPNGAAPSNTGPSNPTPVFDSIIQEVTPDGREVFRWNAWGHLKLSDCLWSLFPREYAKLNSLQLSGGDLIASFRGCSTVLKIERPSGRVLWQLGGSDPGQPDPYDARRPTFERPWHRPTGDPRGGFCAQHTALETAPGRILMFDNGTCPDGNRPSSRVVEYRLGPPGEATSESPGQNGEATFIRHHEPGRLAVYGGAVAPMPNGNWLISWGSGPGDATLSEVDPSGAELFALRLSKGGHPVWSYRVWRRPDAAPGLRHPAAPAVLHPSASDSGPGPDRRKWAAGE